MSARHEAEEAARATVAALRGKAESVLRPLVRPGERCALLDFPNHGNVGDSAIWLGTRALLERLGARVVYASDCFTLRAATLRAAVGDGPIFIQGGGNFGDLWHYFQDFREHIVESFPESRIVQLPQSIHFEDGANLERVRRVFGAHDRLTLLVRERKSLELARTELGLPAVLCPDLAFGLGPLRRSSRPAHDLVVLARGDKETAGDRAAVHVGSGRVADWGDDDPLLGAVRAVVRRVLRPRLLGGLWGGVLPVYDAFARARLRAGVRLLSRGRVVVTDRLHGHILSVLLGVPHVVLDNSYGKLSHTLDAWTGHLPLVSVAGSPGQALELAHALTEHQDW
ncbi:MAG: polysaccharide pyruvyl transferase family protein [Acidobacteria bacterium]|nr:polysaccharide pyruvyl transferase family protein [Acidobacteriota bacterium]